MTFYRSRNDHAGQINIAPDKGKFAKGRLFTSTSIFCLYRERHFEAFADLPPDVTAVKKRSPWPESDKVPAMK